MSLEVTRRNGRIQALDANYDDAREAQYDALERLYNPTLGPVTAVKLYPPDTHDLPIWSSSSVHASVDGLMRDLAVRSGIGSTVFIPGGGKGLTAQQAYLGALGEMAERLLAVLHFDRGTDDIVVATHGELVRSGRAALGPDDLPLFAPEQYASDGFAYAPFESEAPLGWVEGKDLSDGGAVLVPAQLALLYYTTRRGEISIGYPTTGGLVFHTDPTAALLHALYEVIERDAINVRWYRRLPPPRVRIDAGAFLAEQLGLGPRSMATGTIDDVRVYLNTLDVGIPVLTAVAVDRSRRERSLLGGGGAWSTRERALHQAVLELGQSSSSLRFYRPVPWKNIRPESSVAEMSDFFDAAVWFGYAENLPRLSWYTDGGGEIDWSDVPTGSFDSQEDELESSLGMLTSLGFRAVVIEFDAACWPGVHVRKVIVPELTQACIPSHPYLGHPRYTEVAESFGAEDVRRFSDLNPDPVPFP